MLTDAIFDTMLWRSAMAILFVVFVAWVAALSAAGSHNEED